MDDSEQRNPIEVLADEFVERFRRGERPSLQEYVDRHPDFAAEIRELFPLLVDMEEARSANTWTESTRARPFVTPEIEQLGDYRIIREIGRGGMGIVYEAEQVSLGRRVALKVLPTSILNDSKHRSRFQRESKAAASLHHTNIVPVFGVGEENGLGYYVMQLIDGHGLDDVLKELKEMSLGSTFGTRSSRENNIAISNAAFQLHGSSGSHSYTAQAKDSRSLSKPSIAIAAERGDSRRRKKNATYWENVSRIGIQVGKALDYAHKQGVLHRDIKPANLLLDLNGTVWVTDFGLASLEDDRRLTETGDVLGTLRYMAPESFKGSTDARSEVFSLGLTLYELLVLSPAFDQVNRNTLIDSVVNCRIEPIRKLRSDVPADLQTIVHKAIERDPDHRYQTAEELADDLTRFVNDEPIKARRVLLPERFFRWSRHNRGLATLAISLALIVTLTAVGSSISAGYFLNLSNRLDDTVSELTTARGEADSRAEENLRLAQTADSARRLTDSTLADMHTQRGFLVGREGKFAEAALWFANAALSAPHDPHRQSANRQRAENWLSRTMTPLATCDMGNRELMQLQYQPNGHRLLIQTPQQLRVWDWRSVDFLAWTNELDSVQDACWSPNGRRIAIAFRDGNVQVRDVVSGKLDFEFQPHGNVEAMTWSPDGTLIATADRTVQVWKVADQPTLVNQWQHPDRVYALTFNQSGNRLATACRGQQARLFAVGSALTRESPLLGPVRHAPAQISRRAKPVFFDDDQKLVTIDGNRILWWDLATGNDVTPALETEPAGFIMSLAVSPDGEWIAAGGKLSAMLWNIRGESFRLEHGNNVRDLDFDVGSQNLLTTCIDGTARLWSLPVDRRQPRLFPQRERFTIGAISLDGKQIAVGGKQHVTIWRVPEDKLVIGQVKLWESGPWRPRISADGRLATLGVIHPFGRLSVSRVRQLKVADVSSGGQAGQTIDLDGGLVDSCVCSDNQCVAAVCVKDDQGILSCYDIATGKGLFESHVLPAKPVSVSSRPDANQVAVLCDDGHVVVVDIESGELVQQFSLQSWSGDANRLCRVRYTPDGKTLVALTPHNAIEVRDSESGGRRFSPIVPVIKGGPCRAIDISADSRWMATGVNGENVVRVWDLATGQPAGPAIPHSGDHFGITSLAFSPDGRQLLSGHEDGMARLWDWQTGTLLVRPMSHPDGVTDVKVVRDGRYAVAAVRLGTVYFWDLGTGKMVAPPADYPLPIGSTESIEIAGDRLIASAYGRYPLIDLSVAFREPTESIESIVNAASLSSNQKNQLGELSTLDRSEWMSQWATYKQRRLQDSIQEIVALLDQSDDLQLIQRIAEQSVQNGSIEQVLELRPDVPQLHRAFATDLRRRGDDASAAKHRELAIALLSQKLDNFADDQPPSSPRHNAFASELASLIIEHYVPAFTANQSSEDDDQAILHQKLRTLTEQRSLVGRCALAAAWLVSRRSDEAERILSEDAETIAPEDKATWMILQAVAYRELGQQEAHSQVSEQLIEWLGRETLPAHFHSLARRAMTLPSDVSTAEFNELLGRQWATERLAKLSAAIQQSPDSAPAYVARADIFKRLGKWDLSASDLLRAKEIRPHSHSLWTLAADSLIMAGDERGYQQLCQEMVERFQGTDAPPVADGLIKTCLLRPNSVEVTSLPIDLVRDHTPDHQTHYWEMYVACCALHSYRSGDAQAAIGWTEKLGEMTGDAAKVALVVRAMAEHELGETEKARKTLSIVEAMIPGELRTLGTDAYDGPVPLPSSPRHDDLIPEILRREAAEKLLGLRP
ncbi:serine/threonine-protein kinase [Stieleria varia]|uniref:Serine/threonine-protein kinase pkn5 n=1 Tax=Stieleria varia TaxID=2528005 RepID=A0A5C6B8B0_9BACT|nr:serine/threonine-protein kinase [Stieleria varia]TWU08505.1 Serine/threonine-protein kinase pkn5 [Stieleria varia]